MGTRHKTHSLVRHLRNRVLSLALLCVAGTALGLSVVIFYRINQEAHERLKAQARQAALELDDYLDDLLRNLNTINRISGLEKLPPETQERILTALGRHNRAYEQLSIISPDGQLLSEYAHEKSSLLKANLSYEFKNVIGTESDSFGPVHFSPDDEFLSMEIALPIRDGANKLSGVLYAKLNLKFLWFVVSGLDSGPGGTAYLLDHRKMLIASKQSPRLRGEGLKEFIPGIGKKGGDFTGVRKNAGGEFVLCSVAKLHSVPWEIVLEVPLSSAYKPIQQLVLIIIMAVCIALAGALLLSVFLARRIVVPLEKLTESAGRISAGDLDARAPDLGEDELGLFGRTFNLMMDRLKEREKALRESERNLAITMNSIGDAVLATDMEGRIVRMNPVAEKLTGWTLGEAARRRVDEVLKIVNAKTREPVGSPVDKVRKTGFFAGLEAHSLLLSRSGREHQIADSAAPIIDSDGTMIGVVLVFRDISEQHQTQQQLLQAQKMETVGLLAGGLAHDFNNVLGGISGAVSMIKHQHNSQKVKPEEIQKLIGIIEKSIGRASRLVQQLLTLSRRQEISLSPINLNSCVEQIATLCKSSFDKNISIKCLPWCSPAFIRGDAGQIEQLLLNLCLNAAHAMTIMRQDESLSGGTLSIAVESHLLRNTLKRDGNAPTSYWALRVEDSGVGIEQEHLHLIFDPFFTTKKKEQGSGLGLVMVYNIARAHGGFVDVSSTPGQGSVFKVFFPVLENEELPVVPHEAKKDTLSTGSGLILFADDEEVMRDTGQEILKTCGYDVILAKDGAEALDLFRKNRDRISLVILDLVMPQLSGRDAFFEIRKEAPRTKILLSSGYKNDPRAQEVISAGVNGFIQKPYSISALADKIRQILSS